MTSPFATATTPVGLIYLVEQFALAVPPPATRSQVATGQRRTRITADTVWESYPKSYLPTDIIGHLRFALRYEPVDLSIYAALFRVFDKHLLTGWIRAEPTSMFARRAWYLFESLTGDLLDVPDVPPAGYVDLLDPSLHITGPVTRQRRQLINDNLLGTGQYCALVRRTEILAGLQREGLREQAHSVVEECDPAILARAAQYMMTKETKSSFAIEGESPTPGRTERFVAALSHAAEFNVVDESEFIRLQNMIVEARYAQTSWRTTQNYVGQTLSDYQQRIHYVCPKPEDAHDLMNGWMKMSARLLRSAVDPIVTAAVVAFGFVFIHPFDDGNGRIHRFLIHQALTQTRFTPTGLLFPVSAVMLREGRRYDQVLAGFSSPRLPFIEYTLDADGRMSVQNDTAHLYRFWDATAFAEYLYDCLAQTIRHDLKEEIRFLSVFDLAMSRTQEIVDMPSQRASLLVRLVLQNQGSLARRKRDLFAELTDDEIAAIEAAVSSAQADVPKRN